MRNLALVSLASLSLGACTPHMKTAGYATGTFIALTGATLFAMGMAADSEPCDLGGGGGLCLPDGLGEVMAGMLLGPIGLGTLLVTALSPSAPEAPAVPAAASPAAPAAPAAAWPAAAPTLSPSAPSGSPLHPAASLSLRPAAERPSLMAFH